MIVRLLQQIVLDHTILIITDHQVETIDMVIVIHQMLGMYYNVYLLI